jgi:hypothetical protein
VTDADAPPAATAEPIAATRNRVARNFFTADLLGLPEGRSLLGDEDRGLL